MNVVIASQDEAGQWLESHGNITMEQMTAGGEPLQDLLGPEVYSERVFLSLEHSPFIDSSGIGWLVRCHKRFKQEGGALVLHSLPPTVRDVVQLLRLDMVFNLAKDPAAARSLQVAGGGS